ncbi:MAG: hypothetical protein L3K04_06805 [Thermoplasmata archaeon]|nr:hypothetical protein [Thermoplasmata archaeon]
MAKRRLQVQSSEEEPAEGRAGSAEERRSQRKRDRRRREAQGKGSEIKGTSRLRRGLVLGIPAGVVVIAVVVLVFFNPFRAPCLSFEGIPSQSGVPAYPSHNASTDLTSSWCPPGVSTAESMTAFLQIEIQHQFVGLPSSIGRNSTYTYLGQPYNCNLPLNTQPPSPPASPDGTINILSPWPYAYTLSDFFEVWSQSYSGVNVNTTDPNQPITYTSTDLLGFSADATHTITLFVDNQVSSSGPSLELNTLPYGTSSYPSCINAVYGSGHTVLLTYTTTPKVAFSVLSPAATLSTTTNGLTLVQELFYTSVPHPAVILHELNVEHAAAAVTPGWLLARSGTATLVA